MYTYSLHVHAHTLGGTGKIAPGAFLSSTMAIVGQNRCSEEREGGSVEREVGSVEGVGRECRGREVGSVERRRR